MTSPKNVCEEANTTLTSLYFLNSRYPRVYPRVFTREHLLASVYPRAFTRTFLPAIVYGSVHPRGFNKESLLLRRKHNKVNVVIYAVTLFCLQTEFTRDQHHTTLEFSVKDLEVSSYTIKFLSRSPAPPSYPGTYVQDCTQLQKLQIFAVVFRNLRKLRKLRKFANFVKFAVFIKTNIESHEV